MDSTNVDSVILQNMGSLQGLIDQTPVQAVSADGLNPGIQLDFNPMAQTGQGVGRAVDVGSIGGAGYGNPQQPVSPQMDAGEVERLREIAYNATQDKIETEENFFELQLESSNLTEVEKELLRKDRELKQTQQVNGWLNNQQQQQYQVRENAAKSGIGLLIAQQVGLPYDNVAIKSALMNARNPDEMRQIAVGLANGIQQAQRQQVSGQRNSGIFAGGTPGNVGGSAPKPFSGDLHGLINSRPVTSVTWG